MTEDARGGAEQLSAYLDGELEAGEQAAVSRRLEADPAARRELDELAQVVRVLASAPRPTPPRDYRALFAPSPWWAGFMSWTPALAGSAAAILLAVGIVGAIASAGGSASLTTMSAESVATEPEALSEIEREVAAEVVEVQSVEAELPADAAKIQAIAAEAPAEDASGEDTAAAPVEARIEAVERPQEVEVERETEAETAVEAPVATRARPPDVSPEAREGASTEIAEAAATEERAGAEIAAPAVTDATIGTAEPAGASEQDGTLEPVTAEAPVAVPTASPEVAEPVASAVERARADLSFWPYPLAAGAVLLVLAGALWWRQRARR